MLSSSLFLFYGSTPDYIRNVRAQPPPPSSYISYQLSLIVCRRFAKCLTDHDGGGSYHRFCRSAAVVLYAAILFISSF